MVVFNLEDFQTVAGEAQEVPLTTPWQKCHYADKSLVADFMFAMFKIVTDR